ncbi:hypothetical protein K3495_g7782 [Podosphaera aphanis]|nr:hypothetical protein K3495_g7782 [Podosphaera aphanis]
MRFLTGVQKNRDLPYAARRVAKFPAGVSQYVQFPGLKNSGYQCVIQALPDPWTPTIAEPSSAP